MKKGENTMNKEGNILPVKWLSDDLRLQLRSVFESKYDESLSEEDLNEVAISLVNFVESCIAKGGAS